VRERVLITGGAGFIGSHLADRLLQEGHTVRVLDVLDPQVHPSGLRPAYLNQAVEFIEGDVRDREMLSNVLRAIDVIFHFAAVVGVGQSMYEIARYVDVNCGGTATLLDVLVNGKYPVRKLLVASSMSIYGEGRHHCDSCGDIAPGLRAYDQLQAQQWEVFCPICRGVAHPKATDEQKPLMPSSVYAVTKRDQEELCLSVGRAYNIPASALRFFNVYGPRQSLSNPYTGVAAIFISRLMNENQPLIFEDGLQRRDFVDVRDVVTACVLAMDSDAANYRAFNVGTGSAINVRQIADTLNQVLESDIDPLITKKFREGDIRNCYPDISLITRTLGYQPAHTFVAGMHDLVTWTKDQSPVDLVDTATAQLAAKGLVR